MDNGELVEFLERNSNKQHWEPPHARLVRETIDRITNFVRGCRPVRIYSGVMLSNGTRFSEGVADIAVLSANGDLVLIEAEVVPSHRRTASAKNRIERKLQTYSDYFWERFRVLPRTIGVYECTGSGRLQKHYPETVPPSNIDYSVL